MAKTIASLSIVVSDRLTPPPTPWSPPSKCRNRWNQDNLNPSPPPLSHPRFINCRPIEGHCLHLLSILRIRSWAQLSHFVLHSVCTCWLSALSVIYERALRTQKRWMYIYALWTIKAKIGRSASKFRSFLKNNYWFLHNFNSMAASLTRTTILCWRTLIIEIHTWVWGGRWDKCVQRGNWWKAISYVAY